MFPALALAIGANEGMQKMSHHYDWGNPWWLQMIFVPLSLLPSFASYSTFFALLSAAYPESDSKHACGPEGCNVPWDAPFTMGAVKGQVA